MCVQDVTVVPKSAADSVRHAAEMALQVVSDRVESVVLIDVGQVARSLQEWREHLPRVRPCYSVGCQADEKLVQVLRQGHCNFACTTMSEVDLVLSLGVSPEDVVFCAPLKVRAHLRYLKEKGVCMISVDSTTDLRKIALEHPAAELLLQITVCNTPRACRPCAMKNGVAQEFWAAILDLGGELGLQVAGVWLDSSLGCKVPGDIAPALRTAKEIFRVAAEGGHRMSMLDVGEVDCARTGSEGLVGAVREQLVQWFPAKDFPGLRIHVRPGQSLARECTTLLTKIVSKRWVPDVGTFRGRDLESCIPRYQVSLGLKGACFGSCFPSPLKHWTPELLGTAAGPEQECCFAALGWSGLEVVRERLKALPELEEGRWVLWRKETDADDALRCGQSPLVAQAWHYTEEWHSQPALSSRDGITEPSRCPGRHREWS